MAFSKSFPRTIKGSNYPIWEEVSISEEEEAFEDFRCKEENIKLMKDCLEDAKKIIDEKGLRKYQSDLISLSIALFEKRASHSIYWKENKAKEKFDKMFGNKV